MGVRVFHFIKERWLEILILTISLFMSHILFWRTFYINPAGNILVASRLWSDFAATIPLIRSFSLGDNFPPEYPIFPGYPIRYHFVFYLLVGLLEKIGIRLDWSLNLLSSLSFALLIFAIFKISTYLFKKKSVGILAVFLFLFNGSLGFLEFFKTNPISKDVISKIISNTQFSSFGPYDGKIVSAFWSLNIYTNQRHLAFAYASFIFLILFLLKKSRSQKFSLKETIFVGIFVGLFPFIHLAIFGMMGLAILTYFLLFPNIRKSLFLIGILAIFLAAPQIIYMGESQVPVNLIKFGYLTPEPNFGSFLNYWFYNLGLYFFLIPIGFLIVRKNIKKAVSPFILLFIFGNLFQLTPEIAANHKFFNLFLIGGNILVANLLLSLFKRGYLTKIGLPFLLIFLSLTGFIDFFPIVNDRYIELSDIPQNKAAAFIFYNTPKDSVFLNSSFLYHPASIAGRKIFMGWPYFAWSAGYDTHKRGQVIESVFSSKNKSQICQILLQNNIDYLTIEDNSLNKDFPLIDLNFFDQNFTKIYNEHQTDFSILSVEQNCKL